MQTFLNRCTSAILLVGDVLALLVFVLVGERSHELNQTYFVVTALPLVALWLITGKVLGAFPSADAVSTRTLFGNTINTWLVVTPLTVFVRALLLNRATIPTAFFAAAIGFSGLFVLAWRLVFFVAYRFIKK